MMNTLDDLFRRFSSDPFGLAQRICRGFSHNKDELRQAAIRWCDWISALRPIPTVQDAAPTYDLLMLAGIANPIFQSWITEARRVGLNYRGEEYSTYDATLLSAMLFLWPSRHQPELYTSRVCAWAHAVVLADERRAHTPMSLALTLCSFPEVAYALLQHAPLSRWASDVEKDSMLAAASLALFRRLQGHEPHHLDGDALAKPSPAQYLGQESLRLLLRQLLAKGKAVPESIWPEIDRILAGERDMVWYQALALLTGYLPRQADAVNLMAKTLESHPNPAGAFELMSGSIARVGNPFRGHGWKRQEIGRKLVPIARVLVARGIWPTSTWLLCLRPCDDEGPPRTPEEQTERQYDRVKRVLGEALLERASDSEESPERRMRAIAALGRLAPPDDSNLLRALGRFYQDADLGPTAKEAQREARDRSRTPHMDGELCVMDAWEHFVQVSGQEVPSAGDS